MKKIALILSVLIVLTVFPSGALAVSDEHANNYNMLVSLGIAQKDDTLAKESNVVTRAEFVRYAVRAAGFTNVSAMGSIPFADVSLSHPDYGYIKTAVDLGVINGSNGFFLPEEPITSYAVSKIAVHVLGYEILAEAQGGYPTGYAKYANTLKVFDGIEIANPKSLTSGEVAKILVNILNADVLETTSVGDDGNGYTPMENLLSVRHKIYVKEGIVSANSYTSLNIKEGTGVSDCITIDGKDYNTSAVKNAHEFLGMSVKAYYKESSSGKREIEYIGLGDDNKIYQINSDDIISASLTEISYDNGQKEQKLKISKSASVIYNGTLKDVTNSNILSTLKSSSDSVKFADNNSDGAIDVVFAENYRTIFVSGISSKTYSVADSLGGESLILDPNDKTYDIYIQKDGKEATFEDITVNSVISYYSSENQDKILKKLVISTNKIKGDISEFNSNTKEYNIGGNFYKATSYMQSFLDLGISGEFYLDFSGKIVYCRTNDIDVVYGYITGMTKGNPMGSYDVKIFTENNRWVILPVAEKVKYNGITKTDKELYSLLGGDSFKKQLITYLVSSDRKLIRLDTAQVLVAGSEEEKQAINKQTFRKSATYTSIAYRADGPSFEDLCYISDSILFSVPLENASGYTYSDDKFEIITIASLVNSGLYTLTAYDMDEFGRPKVCVLNYQNKSASTQNPIMIVDHITEAVNKEGTVVKAIRGFYMGIEAKILLAENISDAHAQNVYNLSKGDVIRVSLNKDGYAVAVSETKLIDAATDAINVKKMVGTSYGIGTFFAGEVKAVNEAEGLISVDCGYDGGKNAIHRLTSLKSVYIYDRTSNTMTTGSISDISVGSYIYMTSRYLRADSIIVVE